MERDAGRSTESQSKAPVRSIEDFDMRFLPGRPRSRVAEEPDPFERGATLARASISLLASKRDA